MDGDTKTVGEFSSSDFVIVDSDATKEEAVKRFQEYSFGEQPSIYYVYVEENDRLKGVCSVKDLLNSGSLEEAIETDLVTFSPEQNLEQAARISAEYDYQAIPIVENERMVGVLRLDQVLEVIESEETDDIFKKAGVVDKEQFYRSKKMLDASVLNEVRSRLPWLIFALIGGFIAGSVIEVFQESLQAVVLLAFFIPVIMDMGGNVGTQSSTILVRGLTLEQIRSENYKKFIAREGVAGLSIGVITGALAGLIAFIWQGAARVSLVIFISMALTCLTASMIGYAVPLAANHFGEDPASVSDPMVTTVKDITSLIIYFTVASLLLSL